MQTLSSVIIFLLMPGNLSAQNKFGIATCIDELKQFPAAPAQVM